MRVLLFTLVVLSLMSWVGATPYPDSGLRQTMLHWEKSRTSGSPQDRLLKELTMIMSTEADGTKLELLDKYKKRHSGTLYAVWAEYLLLSERAPSNSVRLERLKELARQAGGPSL